ncbi:hypothetical protein SAMN05421510_100428 [Nitrosomonas ureae]|uniref:Uncharacterized protein n=1 Tax=Nitrosomonas ureae TaxID=44577 RepID=A0A1H9ALS3_9PROT|nr:hypothetical protein SAMN05421510_100428 [Nitrosomonas ureae]
MLPQATEAIREDGIKQAQETKLRMLNSILSQINKRKLMHRKRLVHRY